MEGKQKSSLKMIHPHRLEIVGKISLSKIKNTLESKKMKYFYHTSHFYTTL